jgi:glycosyltransferase involved in cell wall biosynthesis
MVPAAVEPARARQQFGLRDPFLVYIGRIDANKGCAELFQFFLRYLEVSHRRLDLVLIGTPAMPVPEHPRVRHFGHLDDRDKFDILAAAEALMMPSYYESLSMVALEAWALGRPVVANGHCDVLLGQCLRSHGGLWYRDAGEFEMALDRLSGDAGLAASLGRRGREYFSRHYSWPVIERKYIDMFDRLRASPATHTMEPLPGWFARHRPTAPAAVDVIARLPSGPVVDRAVMEAPA